MAMEHRTKGAGYTSVLPGVPITQQRPPPKDLDDYLKNPGDSRLKLAVAAHTHDRECAVAQGRVLLCTRIGAHTPVHCSCAGAPRANMVVDKEHPNGITTPPNDATVLQQHMVSCHAPSLRRTHVKIAAARCQLPGTQRQAGRSLIPTLL